MASNYQSSLSLSWIVLGVFGPLPLLYDPSYCGPAVYYIGDGPAVTAVYGRIS